MRAFTLLLVPALLVLAAGQGPVVSGPPNSVPVPGEAVGADGGIDTFPVDAEIDIAAPRTRNLCVHPQEPLRDCPQHCRAKVLCKKCCADIVNDQEKYLNCTGRCDNTWSIVLVYKE